MESDSGPAAEVLLAPGRPIASEAELDRPPVEMARDPDRGDAGMFLDTALVRLAAAREVLPAWTATLLHQLEQRRGYLAIGRPTIHDYSREELGLAPNRLRELRRLGRIFAALPSLRDAVLDGRVTAHEAGLLGRVIHADGEVAGWLARRAAAPSRRAFREQLAEAARGGDDAGDAVGTEPMLAEPVRTEPMVTEPILVDEDEGGDQAPWGRLGIAAPAALVAKWKTTLALARQMEGPAITGFQLAEMLAGEWLSSWAAVAPPEEESGAAPGEALSAEAARGRHRREVHALWRGLEIETRCWAYLSWVRPRARLAAEAEREVAGDTADPTEIHRRLRYLVRLEQELDWQTGRVLHTFRRLGLARLMYFASFSHYVSERLGMSPRRAYYLVELDRRLVGRPEVEEGYSTGTLTWLQAYELCKLGEDIPGAAAWLARARAVSVARLEEDVAWVRELDVLRPMLAIDTQWYPPLDQDGTAAEVEPPPYRKRNPAAFANDDWQPGPRGYLWPRPFRGPIGRSEVPPACAPSGLQSAPRLSPLRGSRTPGASGGKEDVLASGTMRIVIAGPGDGLEVLRIAFASVRAVRAEPALSDADCLETLLDHFVATHENEVTARMRKEYPVFERDGWRCRMPGCRSGQPLHAHHIRFRSHGGGDEPENMAALCWICHERIVHGGFARLERTAEGAILAELGVRTGSGPQSRWVGDRRAEHRGVWVEPRPGGVAA